MTNFMILFDNGGGALLLTDDFAHSYDYADQLATDVRELLSGADTADWDGNEPEYRRDPALSDDVMDQGDCAAAILLGVDLSKYRNGAMRRQFVEALTGRKVEQ